MKNKVVYIVIGILILFALIINFPSSKSSIIRADDNDVNRLLKDKKTTVIDVRTKDEYDDGHIKGAINIPYDEISSKIESYNLDEKTNIIVYCQTGARSHVAAVQLQDLGFKNIYDMGSIDGYDGKLVK